MAAQWPGFVSAPCTGCGHPGAHHQPVCIAHVFGKERAEFCGCPAYHSAGPHQIDLYDTRKLQEERSGA